MNSTTNRQAAALVGAMLGILGMVVATATPAGAAVYVAAPAPVTVVLSGPAVTVTVPVVADAADRPARCAVTVMAGPAVACGTLRTPTEVEEQQSGYTAGMATVTLPTAGLATGARVWTLGDPTDGSAATLPVTVLRQSRFSAVAVTAAGGGMVAVTARLEHYSPPARGYVASQDSPVTLQVLVKGRWRDASTGIRTASTTNRRPGHLGQAVALVKLPAGTVRVRVARVQGATVTGATSRELTVKVS